MIYLIVCEENQTCKIGYSYDNARGRLAAIRCACPYDVDLRYWIKGTVSDEQALHKRFSDHRLKREWFRLTDEIIEYFIVNSTDFVDESVSVTTTPTQVLNEYSLIEIPVIVTRELKRRYKPEEFSILVGLGEKIYNTSPDIQKSIMEYISLVGVTFGNPHIELQQMVSALCRMRDRINYQYKEISGLLEFIDSDEIHNSLEVDHFDLLASADNS